jgi:hypothetical protein
MQRHRNPRPRLSKRPIRDNHALPLTAGTIADARGRWRHETDARPHEVSQTFRQVLPLLR